MTIWTVRAKFTALIERWYIILLVFLISAALAWGVMHVWPPQHQATATVYLGIDINRVFDVSSMATYAKTEPFNIDDYKNWQLSQVESIARSEEVAQKTLQKLRETDSYWSTLNTEDFQRMEVVDWWDMGTWKLRVSAATPELAEQGVEVWRLVFVDYMTELIQGAEKAFDTEGQLRAIENQVDILDSRRSSIENSREKLAGISTDISKMKSGKPVDTVTRWRLWGLVAPTADFSPVWTRLLDSFPGEDAAPQAYLVWVGKVETVLSSQQNNVEMTVNDVKEREKELTEQYLKEIQETKGLSPNLYIELSSSNPVSHANYPDSEVALLGGVIGILVYLIVFISYSEYRGEQS